MAMNYSRKNAQKAQNWNAFYVPSAPFRGQSALSSNLSAKAATMDGATAGNSGPSAPFSRLINGSAFP
jgi:hypothetical protein